MENKYAKYPRIILDPKLINEYKTNNLLKARWHNIEQDMESVKAMLMQGDDGMWFIDYGRAIHSELDEPEEMYPFFLKKHREVIIAGAKKHSVLNDTLSKYVWMAKYHNEIVSELGHSNLLISSSDIGSLQSIEP